MRRLVCAVFVHRTRKQVFSSRGPISMEMSSIPKFAKSNIFKNITLQKSQGDLLIFIYQLTQFEAPRDNLIIQFYSDPVRVMTSQRGVIQTKTRVSYFR